MTYCSAGEAGRREGEGLLGLLLPTGFSLLQMIRKRKKGLVLLLPAQN